MIRYLKIAIEESQDAALWYDKREIGLGSEFMAELDRAYDLIEVRPRDFSIYEFYHGPHEVRRCILKRFSYIVFYTMWLAKPVVIAIAHTSREPLYWIDRLKNLS